MHGTVHHDQALLALREERDDLTVQISLLSDVEIPHIGKLVQLQTELIALEKRISTHGLSCA